MDKYSKLHFVPLLPGVNQKKDDTLRLEYDWSITGV